MSDDAHDVLRTVIEPIVAAEGYDLEDLTVIRSGKARRLSIVVDSDTGVDLDRCAEISRAVSARLDEDDPMGQSPYTLEVGSPGVSRPLTAPRHWRRNTGRLVRVEPLEGPKVVGRVTSASETEVEIDVDGTPMTIPLADIRRAKVQVEFRAMTEDEQDVLDEHDEERG